MTWCGLFGIGGIDRSVSLNRALWVLAEEMRKLRAEGGGSTIGLVHARTSPRVARRVGPSGRRFLSLLWCRRCRDARRRPTQQATRQLRACDEITYSFGR